MRLNYLGIVVLSVFLFSACQNNGESEGDSNTETTEEKSSTEESANEQSQTQQPPQEMPGQTNQGATTEVSDQELQKFASALQEMQALNQMAQQEMVGAVQATGLEIERFSQIRQAQQDPAQEPDASEEELAQFQSAVTELEKIQNKTNQQMEQKIQDQDLSKSRYDEIGNALQNDPQLQARFREIMGPPQQQAPAGGAGTPQ